MEILFEDAAVCVAVKPADLLSEQTPDQSGFADLVAARNKNGYVGVIHRLDRGVGGVMVYAREPRAAAKLSAAVQAREMKKVYLAIVHGEPSASSGELRDLLFHDRIKNKTFVVDRERRGVKEAILSYETLGSIDHAEHGRLSLLRIELQTGRTHQIRVQFSSRGMPLLGDGKYGARDRCPIALFSHRLSFPHPRTGAPMSFSALPTGDVWDVFFCGGLLKKVKRGKPR